MRIASAMLLAALTTTGCASTTPQVALLEEVTRFWRGAEVLPMAPATPCPGAPPATAGASPTGLNGDFNGDGTADAVLRVKTGEGQRLIVGISQIGGHHLIDAGALNDADMAGGLTVRLRGTQYKKPGSAVDFYFGADTIVAAPCTGAPTAYIWLGQSFATERLAQ